MCTNSSQTSCFFVKNNECPLDFLGALAKLRSLTLQFPTCLQVCKNSVCDISRICIVAEFVLSFLFFSFFWCYLQVSCVLQHSKIFAGWKKIVLCLTSWKTSICLVASLLKAAPLVEILVLQVYKLRLLIDRVKSARFGKIKF
jgi:hypothetical protein